MKKSVIVMLILGFVGFLYAGDKLERELKLGFGKSVTIDLNTGGSITVTGWDKELVSIVAEAYGDIDDYQIDITERSKGINIDIDHSGHFRHSGDVDVVVYVPKKVNLEVETMGGSITLDNIEGDIEGETMGGELDLSNLKGNIEMTTMGGEIQVSNSQLDGEVKTMGGDITFRDVFGDVKGSTMGGDIKYLGKSKPGSTKGNEEVRISTMGGEINVDDAPAGANVSTMGGDIHIRSANKYVKAKTMGGDIDIDRVDGSIRASTMGGDATAKMVGNPDEGERDIDISSMGGDITVTVPAGLSMEFKINLHIPSILRVLIKSAGISRSNSRRARTGITLTAHQENISTAVEK